jgi:hypothetical protein
MKTDMQDCSPTIQLTWLEERARIDSNVVADTVLTILMKFGRHLKKEDMEFIIRYLQSQIQETEK